MCGRGPREWMPNRLQKALKQQVWGVKKIPSELVSEPLTRQALVGVQQIHPSIVFQNKALFVKSSQVKTPGQAARKRHTTLSCAGSVVKIWRCSSTFACCHLFDGQASGCSFQMIYGSGWGSSGCARPSPWPPNGLQSRSTRSSLPGA